MDWESLCKDEIVEPVVSSGRRMCMQSVSSLLEKNPDVFKQGGFDYGAVTHKRASKSPNLISSLQSLTLT